MAPSPWNRSRSQPVSGLPSVSTRSVSVPTSQLGIRPKVSGRGLGDVELWPHPPGPPPRRPTPPLFIPSLCPSAPPPPPTQNTLPQTTVPSPQWKGWGSHHALSPRRKGAPPPLDLGVLESWAACSMSAFRFRGLQNWSQILTRRATASTKVPLVRNTSLALGGRHIFRMRTVQFIYIKIAGREVAGFQASISTLG